MNKHTRLATFKSADEKVAVYNRKFYGLVGAGGLVSLGAFVYWSMMGSAISAATTIGDMLALESIASSNFWWIVVSGVIAAVMGGVLARHRRVTAGIIATGITAFSFLMAFVTIFPLQVSDADQQSIKYQTVDWGNPVWEDTQKNVYENVYTPRDSEAYTSEEWYALTPEQQDALRISNNGEITPGKDIVWKGEKAELADGSFLQQVGNKNVCIFEDEAALDAGTAKNCVDMSAPIEAFKTSNIVTLTGTPVVPPLLPALATFVPVALIGGMWDRKDKQKAAIMAAGTSDSLLEERWVTAKATLDAISLAWGDLCADPLSALDHSALLDVSQKRTKDFMDALGASTDFMTIAGRHERTDKIVVQLEANVRQTKIYWDEARRYSSQIGTDWMNPEEQKIANTARGLLELAMDPGASMAERANAAGKAQKMLSKLHSIAVPPPSMLMLERLTALQIEAPAN